MDQKNQDLQSTEAYDVHKMGVSEKKGEGRGGEGRGRCTCQ